MSPEGVWSRWLDAVEAAARDVERGALVRDTPRLELEPLPMPAVPWPASLERRRRQVLATLASATQTVERCRDEAGAALAGLARPQPRATPGYTDGASLDVVG